MNEKIFYDNYLKYTPEQPKSKNKLSDQWWRFSGKYKIFYVYVVPASFDGNINNLHYGRIECTTIREKGHNDEITLSLLYNCGIGNNISDGNTIIGHLGIKGDIENFINNIKEHGYESDNDGIYSFGPDNIPFQNLSEVKNYAIENTPTIINRQGY